MINLAITLLALLVQNVSLQGVVTRSNAGPLSKATVELRTDDNENRLLETITTEDDGRFAFQNIRPGRYRLLVNRSGFYRPPLTLTIAAGQPSKQFQLPMTPASAISGRIGDYKGEAVGNAEVQALKASYQDGQRSLTVAQSVQTNDLGEYRLFWLPPGRYFIVVQPLSAVRNRMMFGASMIGGGPNFFASVSTGMDPAAGDLGDLEDSSDQRFVPVYFPGTIDDRAASAIDLRAGAEVSGVNIVLAPIREIRVRGVVIDSATRRSPHYASLRLDEGIVMQMNLPGRGEVPVNPENGTFEFNLLPGFHTLSATAQEGKGYVSFVAGNVDIDNLRIDLTEDLDLHGRIIVEGARRGDIEALRFSLRRDPPPLKQPQTSAGYSVPLPDGTFTVEAGIGDFRLRVAPLNGSGPGGNISTWRDGYVKSIRFGDADVLNGAIHLEGPTNVPLEVVIGMNPGSVEVAVVND